MILSDAEFSHTLDPKQTSRFSLLCVPYPEKLLGRPHAGPMGLANGAVDQIIASECDPLQRSKVAKSFQRFEITFGSSRYRQVIALDVLVNNDRIANLWECPRHFFPTVF